MNTLRNYFVSLPHEQINLKNSNYSQNIENLDYATNMTLPIIKEDLKNVNINNDKLKNLLIRQTNIMNIKEEELKKTKIQLKEEIDENIKSLKILSAFEK